MSWLSFVAIAVFFDVFRIFTDNYISDVYFKDRGVVSQKMYYAIGRTLAGIIILFLAGFSFGQFEPSAILALILAGALLSISDIPYYLALAIENSTNLGIFIQLAPVLYLILGWLFLDDTLSLLQLVAIGIVLIGPAIIILASRKRSRKIKIHAALLAFLYVFVGVIGNLIFIKVNGDNLQIPTIIQEIALVFLGSGLADLVIMLFMPKWRKRYFSVRKKSKNKVLVPLTASFVLGIIKSFAYRIALVVAPAVAVASAVSDSAKPVAIFFMGILLTLIWPKFGREKLGKKTILVHLAATIFIVIGIILLRL